MILRQFGRMMAIAATGLVLGVAHVQAKSTSASAPVAKTKSVAAKNATVRSSPVASAADLKFRRDLESLLGASIKTARGEMSLRQSKDRYGRVRKQILVGRDFSEIQLDQNGDGTVDYWSVKQGAKSVVASEPSHGRFLRLEVSGMFDRGLQTSTYILSKNGLTYQLLKTRLIGKNVRFAGGSGNFQATDTPTFKQLDDQIRTKDTENKVRSLLNGDEPETIPASEIAPTDDSRFLLAEPGWEDLQTEVFGDDLKCAATDSGVGRLAQLQRQWWNVLKFKNENQKDRLVETLKASNLFDNSCKDDAHKEEFDRMTKSLADVMMSSAKGDSWDSTNSRGRYLRCLEQSNLGVTAAEIERGFLDAMNGQYRSYKLFTCDFKPGNSTAADTFPGRAQVSIYMTAADDSDPTNVEREGSQNNYANILFHELIHTTGITDENIVHAAQACCGDPSAQRGNACTKLDSLVARENRFRVLETYLSRGEVSAIQSSLTTTFGSEDAAKVYRGFLEGLDNYQKGTPPTGKYEQGLISGEEYKKCLATKSDAVCRSEWATAIRSYTDVFFAKQCGIVTSGANQSNCTNISQEFKDKMSNAFVNGMITRVAPVAPSTPTGPSICPSRLGLGPSPARKTLHSLVDIAHVFFAPYAHADDATIDCGSEIGISGAVRPVTTCSSISVCAPASPIVSDGTSQPTISDTNHDSGIKSVPGDSTIDQASGGTAVNGPIGSGAPVGDGAGAGGGVSVGAGGGGSGGGRATTSPLPVQRVDSVGDSRVFADDQYRRATDFVGTTTRHLEEARNSILPRAEAGGRSRSSSDSRLGLKDDFVAFKPGEVRSTSTSIDNPFSEKRSIASIADIGNVKQGVVGSVAGSAIPSASNGAGADAAFGGTGSADQSAKRAAQEGASGAGNSGSPSSAVGGRTTSSVGGDSGKQVGSGGAHQDVLEGMFTRPYREVEPRLNRIEVAEALISAKISVQDAKGRKYGSNRAKEIYLFAGYDKPLKKQKD